MKKILFILFLLPLFGKAQISLSNAPGDSIVTASVYLQRYVPVFYKEANGVAKYRTLPISFFSASTPVLKDTIGMQRGYLVAPTINQTATAGYQALKISPFVQTAGSGAKYLIDAGTNSAAYAQGTHSSKFRVDDQGNTIAAKYMLSALNTAPISATDTGTAGEIRITSGFIYVCIATNTWVRTALVTF